MIKNIILTSNIILFFTIIVCGQQTSIDVNFYCGDQTCGTAITKTLTLPLDTCTYQAHPCDSSLGQYFIFQLSGTNVNANQYGSNPCTGQAVVDTWPCNSCYAYPGLGVEPLCAGQEIIVK